MNPLLNEPLEKLLLRKAKNGDLKRGSQWLANLVYSTMGHNIMFHLNSEGDVHEVLECYGNYAETEDPKELLIAESELSRIVQSSSENNQEKEVV